jgi:transcriptional regulator with XRE-family HTH domain
MGIRSDNECAGRRDGEIMTLGKRIRDTRIEQGVGQEALAKKAGISSGTIYNIESGRTLIPSPRVLRRLSLALGTTPKQLVAPEDKAEEQHAQSDAAPEAPQPNGSVAIVAVDVSALISDVHEAMHQVVGGPIDDVSVAVKRSDGRWVAVGGGKVGGALVGSGDSPEKALRALLRAIASNLRLQARSTALLLKRIGEE